MWNFGSGSYNTEKADEKIKKKPKKSKISDKKNVLENKCELIESKQPKQLEDDLDDLDDFGLDSGEG